MNRDNQLRRYARLRQLMRHYRTTLGLTPLDCVKNVEGMKAARWVQIESGRIVPSLHDGIVLAVRLGVTVGELCQERGD